MSKNLFVFQALTVTTSLPAPPVPIQQISEDQHNETPRARIGVATTTGRSQPSLTTQTIITMIIIIYQYRHQFQIKKVLNVLDMNIIKN